MFWRHGEVEEGPATPRETMMGRRERRGWRTWRALLAFRRHLDRPLVGAMADSVPKDRAFEPVTDPRMNATPLDYKEQFQVRDLATFFFPRSCTMPQGAMTSQYVE